jgi:hypothetical protein
MAKEIEPEKRVLLDGTETSATERRERRKNVN